MRNTTALVLAFVFSMLFALDNCVWAVPLNVDFRSTSNNGGGPGALQSGFVEFAHDAASSLTLAFPNDELAGTGNSVDVTAQAAFWRSR